MRVHVLGLADIPVKRETPCCAFTTKAYHLCKMLRMRGHHVILYGCAGSDPTVADEFVEVVPQDLVDAAHPGADWGRNQIQPDSRQSCYDYYMKRARFEVMKRAEFGAFEPVCATIGWLAGACQNLHETQAVIESGIGYKSTFAKYRVFESETTRAYVWGREQQGKDICQFPLDVVIPNAFDPDMFTADLPRKGYVLFMGRVNDDKGWPLALQACRALGLTLKVVGQLWPGQEAATVDRIRQMGGEWLPAAGIEERKRLMGEAYALMCPTQYMEDFGGVAVEAMLSGTPVIASNWGAFTQTIIHGVTGFHCMDVQDMAWALTQVPKIDRGFCRAYAILNYSLERVSHMYDEYLHRVQEHFTGKRARPHRLHWAMKFLPGVDYGKVVASQAEVNPPSTDVIEDSDIGFYYQVYRQPKATEEVLKQVRAVYPTAPIALVSNGGDDFAEMAVRYGCDYMMGEALGNDLRASSSPHNTRCWLGRLVSAMRTQGRKWLMLLEDDVIVHGKPPIPPTPFASPGCCTWSQEANGNLAALGVFLENFLPGITSAGYGGCGGALLEVGRCLPALEEAAVGPVMARLCDRFPTLLHGDVMVTAALAMGDVRHTSVRNGETVTHGDKRHYLSEVRQ